jgi:hypothetical protein
MLIIFRRGALARGFGAFFLIYGCRSLGLAASLSSASCCLKQAPRWFRDRKTEALSILLLAVHAPPELAGSQKGNFIRPV